MHSYAHFSAATLRAVRHEAAQHGGRSAPRADELLHGLRVVLRAEKLLHAGRAAATDMSRQKDVEALRVGQVHEVLHAGGLLREDKAIVLHKRVARQEVGKRDRPPVARTSASEHANDNEHTGRKTGQHIRMQTSKQVSTGNDKQENEHRSRLRRTRRSSSGEDERCAQAQQYLYSSRRGNDGKQ